MQSYNSFSSSGIPGKSHCTPDAGLAGPASTNLLHLFGIQLHRTSTYVVPCTPFPLRHASFACHMQIPPLILVSSNDHQTIQRQLSSAGMGRPSPILLFSDQMSRPMIHSAAWQRHSAGLLTLCAHNMPRLAASDKPPSTPWSSPCPCSSSFSSWARRPPAPAPRPRPGRGWRAWRQWAPCPS